MWKPQSEKDANIIYYMQNNFINLKSHISSMDGYLEFKRGFKLICDYDIVTQTLCFYNWINPKENDFITIIDVQETLLFVFKTYYNMDIKDIILEQKIKHTTT